MVIQVRGTSGAGKSWVVRQVMGHYEGWHEVYEDKRKRPTYCLHPSGIAVIGHYQVPCGGAEKIGTPRILGGWVRHLLQLSTCYVVLVESLLLSNDVKWSLQLPDLRVVFLTTPVEQCLKQLEQRRQAAGNTRFFNPAVTINRVSVIERVRLRLLAAGVDCRRASAEQAVGLILRWLYAIQELKQCNPSKIG